MDFNEQALTNRLSGRYIGSGIRFFNEVESTNDVAFNLALHGAPEGTIVIADLQTKGRGRMKRVWQSPPRCNLYTSIVLRPLTDPASTSQIPLMTGVAAADALSRYCPRDVTLKWPNDVQIRGKKVCGILAEMKTAKDPRGNFVIVGIGVNINIRKKNFDESFREIATSLKEETGRDISRLDFAVEFFDNFEKWYRTWLKMGFEPVREAWLAYASMVGRQVQVVFQGDVRTGEVHGIDESGAMLLEDENGIIKKIMAGDATLVRH